jgi:predicted enzyme related to lactoylglutathione lyase
MPERTGYAHGVPSWVDLGTSDVEGAKAFYGAIFGWEAEDVPTDQGVPYTMLSKDGKVVAGLGPIPPDQAAAGMPPMWNSYVNVDSVDDTIAKVTAAGGSVMMPAMDVMDAGRMAFVADPAGAAIGLWQAGNHKGAELVNEHGTLYWNELITDDTAVAEAFYTSVFGWRAHIQDMPTGPYTSFWADGNVEGHAAAGMMAKNEGMGPIPNYWGVYFAVDDVDAILGAVKDNGGQVLMPAMDIPEVGRFAVIQDPQGAHLSVMTPTQEPK